MRKCIVVALILLTSLIGKTWAVTINWTSVGNPGNAADPLLALNRGAVGYSYNIGTYDVTNSQYAEFLNAKDPNGSNSLGLYSADPVFGMGNAAQFGGINFNNSNANGSKYSVISGAGNHPVNYVTWYDAIRFANWINNGQGNGDTENGAYTLLGGLGVEQNDFQPGYAITRNAGASVYLPSNDEWYKAAYYSPATSSYFLYPTSSNAVPNATSPTSIPNSANFDGAFGHLTDVGTYPGTTSPYGAFDMGGNVWQWTDSLQGTWGPRIMRGGSLFSNSAGLVSATRILIAPYDVSAYNGFRLVQIPEPSSLVLAAFGFSGLALWCWRRRSLAR